MGRPTRKFKTAGIDLEGRLLLAAGLSLHAPPVIAPRVYFLGDTMPGTANVTQVALQQDGEATIQLGWQGLLPSGAIKVVVATDPSSPAVGVNVGAVNQTLTIDAGQSPPTVTVPILAGAPNPGEVDVNLTITPIDPPPNFSSLGPLELRILASDATLPPKILSARGTPDRIVLQFSKAMDPAGASNVDNYAVHSSSLKFRSGGIFGTPLFGSYPYSSTRSLPLQSAQYDAATRTVTLIPVRKLRYGGLVDVEQGHPTKGPGRAVHPSTLGPPLLDLQGHPINSDTTPGKFETFVVATR